MSANEQTPNTDRMPTEEELSEIKSRVAKQRVVLEDAGLQPSASATTGTKLVRYFAKVSGASPKEMTIGQWNAAFSTLDGLLKDGPNKAIRAIDDACGCSQAQTEEDAKIAKQRRADVEEAWRKEQKEQQKRREEERKKRDERAGPHAQRIKELAAKFLREIEAEGYEGYAIVGIPNLVIESRFEKHLESCKDCESEDVCCDEGLNATFEDDCFENIFVYKTSYAGDTGDYVGLAFELGDTDGMYPYTSDLLNAAEPYQPQGPVQLANLVHFPGKPLPDAP